MLFKNFLRLYWPYGCFMFKRLTQLRKQIYLNLYCQPKNFKIPFLNKFQYEKKSNTLFILGSAGSVLDLNQSDWDHIKAHDSVGFNHWLLHDFVPDFYMFEVADKCGDPAMVKRAHDFFYNLCIKEKEYQNVKMIYKMNTDLKKTLLLESNIPPSLFKNIYYSPVIFLAHHDLVSFKKILHTAFRQFDKSKHWQHIHTHATMFDLILFAVKYQFKNIVLTGTDLTSTYFYELESYKNYLLTKDLKMPFSLLTQDEIKNDINGIESWFSVPMSTIIDVIDKTILQPLNIKLYVGSKKSRLYPRFPCYFGEDNLTFQT